MDPIEEDHTVHLTRRFDVTIERLFREWSDPDSLAAWGWGSLGHSTRAEVDFRVGGSFRVETRRPEGAIWSFSGTYTAIEPRRRIVHTLRWDAPMGYPTVDERVEIGFHADGDGTIVEWTHTGLPDEKSATGHRAGWENVLNTLAERLERARSTERGGNSG